MACTGLDSVPRSLCVHLQRSACSSAVFHQGLAGCAFQGRDRGFPLAWSASHLGDLAAPSRRANTWAAPAFDKLKLNGDENF